MGRLVERANRPLTDGETALIQRQQKREENAAVRKEESKRSAAKLNANIRKKARADKDPKAKAKKKAIEVNAFVARMHPKMQPARHAAAGPGVPKGAPGPDDCWVEIEGGHH